MPWASNATLLVDLALGERSTLAVYKPGRGERPLWDYPPNLFHREIAVSMVDDALGWNLVPPTVWRDGPFGPGSVQQFVATEGEDHYFTVLERPEHHGSLQAMAVLDILVNNGDRKSGHCLLSTSGAIQGIDHGLCLHADPKLRTVIWDFAGRPIPEPLVADVARLAGNGFGDLIRLGTGGPNHPALLNDAELEALTRRAENIIRHPRFPILRSERAFPWPLI